MTTSKDRMIELCQGQLEAYNNGDITRFATYYHREVQAYRLKIGAKSEPFLKGIEDLIVIYKKRFSENPNLFCELKSRIVLESSVVDEELVSGITHQEKPSHVVAIYHFKDNLIHSIWFTN